MNLKKKTVLQNVLEMWYSHLDTAAIHNSETSWFTVGFKPGIDVIHPLTEQC